MEKKMNNYLELTLEEYFKEENFFKLIYLLENKPECRNVFTDELIVRMAIFKNNKNALAYALNKGFDTNGLTYDILLYSIKNNDVMLAEYALSHKVDLSQEEYYALKFAVISNCKEIARFIIDILEKENKNAIEIIANQLSMNFDVERNKKVLTKLVEEY